LCCTTLHADEYTPTYNFDGVITVLGVNPTCGASSFPCTETIDTSFQYYIDLTPVVDAAENVFIVPGTLSESASGSLGAVTTNATNGVFFENDLDFSYLEFDFGSQLIQFDLNVDPLVPPSGSFNADTYLCFGECNTLFGGSGGIGSLPTTLDYEITPVSTPEPGTFSSLALGIGALVLLMGLRKRRLPPFVAAPTINLGVLSVMDE